MSTLDTVFVIGAGEVGTRLKGALDAAGATTVAVTRSSGWEEAASEARGLRLVCVREEDLAEVLDRLRGIAGDDLALIQNGWIRPLLPTSVRPTRGLIWFTSKGDFFRVLRPSPFSGPRADELAAALDAGGMPTAAVGAETFAALEADKMGFNCVVGLPLAVHQVSLGEYLEHHREEARAVFEEAVHVTARAAGAATEARWWPQFVETVQPLSWVRASKPKAMEYRNGAVVRLADELGLDAGVNRRLVEAARAASAP